MITAFLLVFLVLPFLVVPDPEHLQDPGPYQQPGAATAPTSPGPMHLLHPVHQPGVDLGSGPPTTPSATEAPHSTGGSSNSGPQQAGSQGQSVYGGVQYNRPGYQRRVRELLVPSHLDFKR